MKKSVLVLLVLLAVLIVTCVYQKTYALYSTSPKELTLVERKATVQGTSTENTSTAEKKSMALPVVSVPTKPVEVKPAPKPKPVLENKPVVKTDKTVTKENKTSEQTPKTVVKVVKPISETTKTVSKEAKSETILSSKSSPSESKVPAVLKKETNTPKPVAQNSAEEEIVDYIMWALKNRDLALKNRDEVQARIQELITRAINDRKVALKDRKVVLDERSKNEVTLDKLQTELIDARDADYENVINPKTTTQGEK